MSTPIHVIAILIAKPGQAEALQQALTAAVTPSRAEAGCLQYHLHIDSENPHRCVFVELWKDEEAIALHRQMPHYLALGAATKDLITSRELLVVNQYLEHIV
ncbi:antibiotic biosynthesis monooxygenase [Neisseriaceae bacterium TC5R-5]|nr:antibiotic biosynthesis monooxygenase [Neisseriaceae bacterium TC5R-5]